MKAEYADTTDTSNPPQRILWCEMWQCLKDQHSVDTNLERLGLSTVPWTPEQFSNVQIHFKKKCKNLIQEINIVSGGLPLKQL